MGKRSAKLTFRQVLTGIVVGMLALVAASPANAAPFEAPHLADQQTGGGAWLNLPDVVQPFRVSESGQLSHLVLTVATDTPAMVSVSLFLADAAGAPVGEAIAVSRGDDLVPSGSPAGIAQAMNIVFPTLPELSADQIYAIVIESGYNPAAINRAWTALSLNPLVSGGVLRARASTYEGTGRLSYQVWFVTSVIPVAPTADYSECGVLPAVTINETPGVTFETLTTADRAVVTASAVDGARIPSEVTSEWVFAVQPCPVPQPSGDRESRGDEVDQPAQPALADQGTPVATLAATGDTENSFGVLVLAGGMLFLGAAVMFTARSRKHVRLS